MQATLLPTNEWYHAIIATPDAATRQQMVDAHFITPWAAMMQAVAPMLGVDPADPRAVAREWGWLLAEDLIGVPDQLAQLEAANAWEVGAAALEQTAAAFAPYADRLPFDAITGWLVLADPARADPVNRGYTGATDWTTPRLVGQFDTPNAYNLPRLPGLLAHEMQHLVRMAVFPFNMQTTVADYIVHEGTAEALAAELFGAELVGYYVTEISDDDLASARRLIAQGLALDGFNTVRGYIFGDRLAEKWGFDAVGMPDFGGYAVGYRVVQAYLERTGQSAVAATFTPAAEIIAGSGYFDS